MKFSFFPIKKNNKFANPNTNTKTESLFLGTIPSFVSSLVARWYRKPHSIKQWSTQPVLYDYVTEPRITWIGHATFLIQCNGMNIITDPVFGNVTPAFKRLMPPGISLEALPPIDYILISHNHRDHFDAYSIMQLVTRNPKIKILVPEGDKQWFDRRGIKHVSEYMWGDVYTHANITCTFLPAVHWSQRGVFDKNKSLWGSWMIQMGGHTIYFAGDTAWGNHFSYIRSLFSRIDYALLPIGPCEPHTWMQHTHINAQQAVTAFQELSAQVLIPMHWGTFPFGNDQFDGPLMRLYVAWKSARFSFKQLLALKIGESSNHALFASHMYNIPNYHPQHGYKEHSK